LAIVLSSAGMSEGTRMEMDFKDGFRFGKVDLLILLESR